MTEQKTDWKTPLIVIGAVVLVAIIVFLFMNGAFSKKLSQEDIQISNFRYAREDSSIAEVPFSFYEKEKGMGTSFTATITTNKKDLHLKVYNAKDDLEIVVSPLTLTNIGSNKISGYDLYLKHFSEQPELKFCISTKYNFNQYSNGVFCKIETFDNPEFKYEITPNPITFLINEQNKDEFGRFLKEEIVTIKNIGEINAPIDISLVDYSNELFYNQNVIEGSCQPLRAIRPGESCEYILESTIVGDIPIGTYETKGFIYYGWHDGKEIVYIHKKEFTLKTIVNL